NRVVKGRLSLRLPLRGYGLHSGAIPVGSLPVYVLGEQFWGRLFDKLTCLDFLIHVELRISTLRQTHWACDSPDCCGVATVVLLMPDRNLRPSIGQVPKAAGI